MQEQPDKHTQPPVWERVAVFVFGVTFSTVLLTLVFKYPDPTPFQYTVCRIILALSAAAIATLITGFLEVQVPRLAKAGGAFAVFIVVFFYSPAALLVNHLDTARQSMNSKYYDDAERQLNTTLLADPEDRAALNLIGSLYWKTQRPEEALAKFEQAAKLATGDERDRYLHNVAAAELRLGKYADASRTLEDVLKRAPTDLATRYNYGIAEAQLGQLDKAREIFTELYELGEHRGKDYRPTAALQLGLIDLLDSGTDKIQHAIAHFEDAVRRERPFDQLFLQVRTVVNDENFELENRVLSRFSTTPEYEAFKSALLGGVYPRSPL